MKFAGYILCGFGGAHCHTHMIQGLTMVALGIAYIAIGEIIKQLKSK